MSDKRRKELAAVQRFSEGFEELPSLYDNGIELVSCPEHLAQDLEKFNVGQEIEDVFKIYHAIICEPEDSPAYKEAMRLLAGYILGKD